MDKKLRIMHGLSEVAGQNSYSVYGLKRINENAECIIFYKHPFEYEYDKCLNLNKSKKILFPFYAVKLLCFLFSALKKYDCFHFHFGHSILDCHELFIYRLFKKKIFFEFHGTDLRDYEKFCKLSGMNYNPGEATSVKQHKRNKKICKFADGIIIHDDELIPYLPKICAPVYVVPLRVNISNFTPVYPQIQQNKIRIIHAPSHRAFKGTKFVIESFNELTKKYNNIEIVLVEGKTQKEAFELYKTADIIVDQLFAGTYGVFAIEAMALGKPVITYISDEMKSKLPEELPIVNANSTNLKTVLENLINNAKLRYDIGVASRKYVENYHDYRYCSYILRDIYYGNARQLTGRDAFMLVREIKENIEKKNV